jgi:4-diphosphocytidyl-2-C-methyl-D-erythritol kinase
MGVNDLLGLGLSKERLMEIGVTLGADVPFFIFERPALAEGIGEKLTPLQAIPPVWLVLVNPRVAVSTAWVYQNLQLTMNREPFTMPLSYRDVSDVCAILANDLESVTITKFPVIAGIKQRLLDAGACGSLMSGSGPTVFGIFADESTARQAEAAIRQEEHWFTAVMQTLC